MPNIKLIVMGGEDSDVSASAGIDVVRVTNPHAQTQEAMFKELRRQAAEKLEEAKKGK